MLMSEVDIPVPGFYRLRLVKSGPWCAVKIWDEAERDPETNELIEDQQFRCLINGKEVDPWRYAERVNCFGQPIDEAEYRYMLDTESWARTYDPEAPEADPYRPVDINKIKPVF